MAQSSLPWSTTGTGHGPAAPGYTFDKLRTVFRTLALIDPTTQAVAAGRLNEFLATGSSSPVVVQSGEAIVDGEVYLSSASENIAITTPVGGSRIDRIILRADTTANSCVLAVVQGTVGGAMGGLVTTSSTYEVELWRATITTGGVITLSDQRVFAASPLVRGALDNSTLGWNTTSKKAEIKDGGITGAKLNQTSISYPGQVQLTKTGGSQSSALLITAASPAIGFLASGGGANGQRWDIAGGNTTLSIRGVNDTDGAVFYGLIFTRSGMTLSAIQLGESSTTVTIPGNLTVSGTITGTVTVSDGSITSAKLANMAQATVKGRASGAGTGVPSDLSASQLVTIINTADGSGSGLDADLLDGNQATAFATASHVHSAADITSGNLVNARLATMAAGTVKGRAVATGTDIPVDLTATQLVTILLTADGASSGLDADLLDGEHASAFADASHTHAASDITSGTFANSRLATVATNTIKGRVTASTGAVEDLTAAQALTVLGTAGGFALAGRQGGSATDWSASGTTNRTVTPPMMQCGTVDTGGSTSVTVTFPVAFSQPPVVVTGQRWAPFAPNYSLYISAVTATTVTFQCNAASQVVSWIAIGPA